MTDDSLPVVVGSVDDIRCPWCGQVPFHHDVKDGQARVWLLHTSDRDTGAPCPGKDLMRGRRYVVAPVIGEERR
jgi:hypothetical protein